MIPPGITYATITPSVFVAPAVVKHWADTKNASAAQAHAAALWSGLTSMTAQTYHGRKLAVFDTWYTPCDVYPPPIANQQPPCNSVISQDPATVDVPNQFVHNDNNTVVDVFASVRYNREMKNFAQPYASGTALAALIAKNVKNLPDKIDPHAMMLKPSYQLVSTKAPTLIHVWTGPGLTVAGTTSPDAAGTSSWTKVVLVDPTGKAKNDTDRTFCVDYTSATDANDTPSSHKNIVAKARTYRVVPLTDFYYIRLDPATVERLKSHAAAVRTHTFLTRNRQFRGNGAPSPTAAPTGNGPCPAVNVDSNNAAEALVAMHVTSAELDQVWTWQTFWYQPSRTAGLPGSAGPFAHFDVATAYWRDDTEPYGFRYAFNPYTEAAFNTTVFNTPKWPVSGPGSVLNLGRTTNCIACHSTATYTIPVAPSIAPGYVAHGKQPQIPTTQSILTLNMWSLASRAGHPSGSPSPAASSSP
jgi:hypothetical protein